VIFISTLIVLNLVLLFTGYHASEPNTHNVSAGRRMRGYVANRAGNLAFANFSIMVLCSSRNNLFVRLTKFSYSTMLLFHRWSAYLCTAHASVHTVIYIINHINLLPKKFGQAYWNWGVGAATLMLLILPLSTLPVRKRAYELFLAGHNMMAAGVFIACYYHIYMNYQHEYGYENWIYLPAVLWILDRGLRLMRLARNGIRTATVTRLDHDYLRVDIPRVDVQGHVFLYFPTLRIWQTHPFSVAASLVEVSIEYKMDTLRRSSVDEELAAAASEWHTLAVDDSDDDEEEEEEEEEEDASDEGATTKNEKGSRMPLVSRQASQNLDNRAAENEKQEPDEDNDESSLLPTPRHTNPSSHPPSPAQTTTTIPGATFYIRRHSGITALLFRQNLRSLPVLLEGPYSPHRHIPSTTHLLCIAGGVGITGALPAFTSHAGVLIASGTRIASSSSLYWSCRSPALVQDVEGKFLGLLQSAASAAVGADGSRPVEVRVKTEGRWDVDRIVHDRARSLLERDGGDVVVLVCGPPGMADAVRRAVVRVNLGVGKTKLNDKGGSAVGRVRLIEEGFWW
jgi:NAD(P)H-flavin reductase